MAKFKFNDQHLTIVQRLFHDLTMLWGNDQALFHELFYDRKADSSRFKTLLESVPRTDTNFTILGEAGIGKTTFIYNVIDDHQFFKAIALYPILVDYRTAVPRTSDGCVIAFINEMLEYFQKHDNPLNGAKPNTPEHIAANLMSLVIHLARVQNTAHLPHIVLILDDFDYADDVWHKLLDYFLPFSRSRCISVVLTARPLLYASIDAYDERFSYTYLRDANTIKLQPMEVREVLVSRLAPILIPSTDSFFSFLTNRNDKNEKALLSGLDISSLEDLDKFSFPFTEKHNDFLRLMTNGNLREVFGMAFDSLAYILQNYDQLETREEVGFDRKVIGREGVMKLFYDNCQANYRLQNIHLYRSRKDTSLLFNVLEAIQIFQLADNRLYKTLQELGHSRKEVEWAINYLADRSNRFIQPVRLLPKNRMATLELYSQYELSDKGQFYLNSLVAWDEYRTRCGACGPSLKKAYRT